MPFVRTLTIVMLVAFVAPAARADGIVTYQGELQQAGAPVDGAFDMQFKLFDAEAGGAQIGATFFVPGVPVADGIFTVEIDFGVAAFRSTAEARWLEVVVDGVTIDPRQRIRAAPYALDTRGIYADDAGNVGIGTTQPKRPFDVAAGSAGNVTAHARSIAAFESSGHGYLSLLTPNGSERGLIFGDTDTSREAAIIYNAQSTPDGLEFLNVNALGYGLRMKIDAAGDTQVLGRLGVNAAIGSAQLSVAADGADNAVNARSSDGAHATIHASNLTSGLVLQLTGTADASYARDGLLMIGPKNGQNIIFDANEIMARNNGGPAPIYFNAEGGGVRLGPNGVRPPLAYGFVDSAGTLVRSSGNVISWRTDIGRYRLAFDEGVRNQDVIIVTGCPSGQRHIQAYAFPDYTIDQVEVRTREAGQFYFDSGFSFLIYRP